MHNKVGNTARSATADAAQAIADNPGTLAGRRPQAVVITQTDAPPGVGNAIRTANNPGPNRKLTPGAATPEHVRGLPGRIGMIGKGLTFIGFAFSALALYGDYQRGDVPMGVGDALSAVGGGLEIYPILSPGAAVFGASAMTVGLVVGGLVIAIAWGQHDPGDPGG